MSFVMWGTIYRKRYAPGRSRWAGIGWGLANAPYALLVPLCNVMALWRLATRQSGWTKTARNAVPVPAPGLPASQPPPPGPVAPRPAQRRRHAGAPIAVVAGTRPEIIKLAPVIRALGGQAQVIHSGQHYDVGFSEAFLTEAGLPAPRHRLSGVGGELRSTQIAAMIDQLGRIWAHSPPAAVIAQGYANTTSAAAQAASYVGIPLIHVEAGLRS